jgi:BatD DUF11 like domain
MNAISVWSAIVLALASSFRAPASPAAPQRQARVSARLSTGVVKLGSDVHLIIEVEGVEDAKIGGLPTVDGLKIGAIEGPSLSMMEEISGGRRVTSRTLAWSALVRPTRKGDFTIPPVTVRADGRDLATRELELRVVEDLQGEELGFFEIDAPAQVADGQPFTIELRFGWDAALDQSINYANLSLPWMGELAGLVELDAPAAPPGTSIIELQLNSHDRIRAERAGTKPANGRTFELLRVRKRYIATRPGKLEFATSHLEFGRITGGSGFFFNSRPAEKETYYKGFPAFDIDVFKLPEKGRPLDFTGAVGRISAHASADRRDVDVGDSIKLAVEWTGDANLEFFDPPDLARMEAFKGFRVYGTTDRKAYDRRTVTYDIAPISADVHAIPSVALPVFDPTKKSYATVDTDPIDIRVRPLKNAAGLGPEIGASSAELDIRDIHTHAASWSEARAPGTKALLAALFGVPVAWLALRTFVRRRGDPDAPSARARRRARKALARELAAARKASEQTRALCRFLAARSGESEEAWLGRDVVAWSRAEHAGLAVGPDEARGLAALFADLDERAYAGGDEGLDAARMIELADRLAKGGL